MNYHHGFHAGNHADVLKHIALLELLRLLTAKDKPLTYVETHAGAGGYALGDDAERTSEWRDGIGRIWPAQDAPEAVARYLAAVRAFDRGDHGGELRRYPGSPWLAAHALRPQDRLLLSELQPAEARKLARRFQSDARRVHVRAQDGYAMLKAALPPPERRALVLIDPPYESQSDEFAVILDALRSALKRFATGVYAIWYPIKLARTVAPFLRDLAALPAKSAFTAELLIRDADSPLILNGSGIAVLNPPWRFDESCAGWLPWLSAALAAGRGAGHACRWLKREAA